MSNRSGATTKVAERQTTIAAALVTARTQRGTSIGQVAAATHIPERYLRLFEETPASRIADDAYTRIYLKAYAAHLGLSCDTILEQFRQAKAIAEVPTIDTRRHPSVGVATSELVSIPKIVRRVLFGLVAVGVFAYLGLSLATSFASPHLTVLSPVQGDVVAGGRVGVTGTTEPEVTVSINGQPTPVDANGEWGDTVELQHGKNDIMITATKKYGRPATVHRTVIAE
jgi:hypothetical protein